VTREIIDLAIRYNLVSRETSLVAIEHRETPVKGNITLRRVPIALTEGWGGVRARRLMMSGDTGTFPGSMDAMLRSGLALEAIGSEFPQGLRVGSPPKASRPALSRESGAGFFSRIWRKERPDEQAGDEQLRRLVLRLTSMQRADGSWQLSEELADVLGWPMPVLLGAAIDRGVGSARARDAWATAIALAWLDRYANDIRDEWELIARKGREWLTRFEGGSGAHLAAASQAMADRG
jgi:hypothetical protein